MVRPGFESGTFRSLSDHLTPRPMDLNTNISPSVVVVFFFAATNVIYTRPSAPCKMYYVGSVRSSQGSAKATRAHFRHIYSLPGAFTSLQERAAKWPSSSLHGALVLLSR